MHRRLGLWLTFSSAMIFSALLMAGDGSKHQQADCAVRDALRLEAVGAPNEKRRVMLDRALSYDKEHVAAQSQSGKILMENDWVSLEEFNARSAGSRALSAYEKQRARIPDSEEGNWLLAAWCESRSLKLQRFAHLRRVLELNSKNIAARIALGWRATDVGWISPEQYLADVRFALEEKESLKRYGHKLNRILAHLSSTRHDKYELGMKELAEIQDPLAVVAIEKVISSQGDDIALLAIDALSALHHPASTRSLARHAIFHPSVRIRNAATNVLVKRDPQGWAPGMVDLLRNEIDLKIMPEFGANGSLLGLRHVFSQEGRDSNNVFVADSNYQRSVATVIAGINLTDEVVDQRPFTKGINTRVASASNESLLYLAGENYAERINQEQRINLAATTAALNSKYSTEHKNKLSKVINDRVYESLDKLEGKRIGNEPEDYWAWWNARKYWRTLPHKKNLYEYNRSVVTDLRPAYAVYERFDSYRIYNTNSCLTESAVVWLQSGPRSIKDVKIGDLALSKEIATGKLRLAPVVRTTISPEPIEIISFSTDDETIECTKGHEFFVSGRGWTMACNLKVGDSLHGAEGARRIAAICEPPKAMVYNLVVADTANYLVGDGKLLTHDFSERAENYYLVPGLAPSND
jgi:hypothetical protein